MSADGRERDGPARGAMLAALPRLRRHARALTGRAADADDLVQDTVERALTRMGQLRDAGNPLPWLLTIMNRVFLNQRRAHRPETGEAAIDPADPRAGDGAAALRLRDLARGLDALPPDQRQALVLVSLEGLSYQQAAAAAGIPIGTLMSRLARGREALRQQMEGRAPALRRVK